MIRINGREQPKCCRKPGMMYLPKGQLKRNNPSIQVLTETPDSDIQILESNRAGIK